MDKNVTSSLEHVRQCYASICDHMWQGILDAVYHYDDFKFDEELLKQFEEAVSILALINIQSDNEYNG